MHAQSGREVSPMKNVGALKLTTRDDREIILTRVFDAPRHLVFKAFTEPALVKQWLLGPPGWSMPVCEIDLRVGGAYRYVWRADSGGAEMGTRGVFREIVAPERIVCAERFDVAWYPGECLNTTTFAEHAGKTTLTLALLYESREARDAVLKTPMEKGVAMSYDRLAELLASLPASASQQ
jgi:uncharacterized protein YndB with AHSA1/START domain